MYVEEESRRLLNKIKDSLFLGEWSYPDKKWFVRIEPETGFATYLDEKSVVKVDPEFPTTESLFKEAKDNSSKPSLKFSSFFVSPMRKKIKISRIMRQFWTSEKDDVLQKATSLALGTVTCFGITTDFTNVYNEENYYRTTGTLGHSCMRYHHCWSFFKFYEIMGAEVLVLYKDDRVAGRAIIWEGVWPTIESGLTEPFTLMDRVYTNIDGDVALFIEYAKKEGWAHKRNQGLDCEEWVYKGKVYNNSLTFTPAYNPYLVIDQDYNVVMTSTDPEDDKNEGAYSFPYLDTLCYLQRDKDGVFFLSNSDVPFGFKDCPPDSDLFMTFRNTDGDYTLHRVQDVWDNKAITRTNAIWSKYHDGWVDVCVSMSTIDGDNIYPDPDVFGILTDRRYVPLGEAGEYFDLEQTNPDGYDIFCEKEEGVICNIKGPIHYQDCPLIAELENVTLGYEADRRRLIKDIRRWRSDNHPLIIPRMLWRHDVEIYFMTQGSCFSNGMTNMEEILNWLREHEPDMYGAVNKTGRLALHYVPAGNYYQIEEPEL